MAHPGKRQPRASRKSSFHYQSLEARQLLAAVPMYGTASDDVYELEFVDETTVNVVINGSLTEGVDVTDGLFIDLWLGNDSITIDHRITAEITLAATEELVVDGGDNYWELGGFNRYSTGSGDSQGDSVTGDHQFEIVDVYAAGHMNGNIRFADVEVIRSGGGNDTFLISTEKDFALKVFGGDGNDTFQFFGPEYDVNSFDQSPTPTSPAPISFVPVATEPNKIFGFGEGGDDRFEFDGQNKAEGWGGLGFDVVDKSRVSGPLEVTISQMENGFQNDRYIGNPDQSNKLEIGVSQTLDWIIGADWAYVIDRATGQSTEVFNFDSFEGSRYQGINYVWVQETARELRFDNMTEVQVGSHMNLNEATLDTIQHDVMVSEIPYELFLTAGPSELSYLRFTSKLILADRAGDGTNLYFDVDQSIHLETGAKVRHTSFGGYLKVDVHGSDRNDNFVFTGTKAAYEIHGYGGDDSVMIGGVNGSGALNDFGREVYFNGGTGTDRLYLNDQNFDSSEGLIEFTGDRRGQTTTYHVDESSITFSRLPGIVKYNDTLEVARINGSKTDPSVFNVTPSRNTKFVFESESQISVPDVLTVQDHSETGTAIQDGNQGAWVFDEAFENIHFYGVESAANSSAPVSSSLIRYVDDFSLPFDLGISSFVAGNSVELDQLIGQIEELNETDQYDDLIQKLQNLDFDFSISNFVILYRFESSISNRLTLNDPVVRDGNYLIEIDRFVPTAGAQAIAEYSYGYEVDKSITELVFDVGGAKTVVQI
jgi:hypothetical protein